MGRWAQRQRSGGGVNQPITIINVQRVGTLQLHVTFSKPVDYNNFLTSAFTVEPLGIQQDAVGPVSADTIGLLYGTNITAQTEVTFTGSVANVVSPQTVPLP